MQRLYILITIILISLISTVSISAKTDTKDIFTVVIDPGHGGNDKGASDNGVNEKDINLKVALELESLLKRKLKDSKVVMTRNKDMYLTLQERADKANNAKGDIFVSIHTNSVDKKNKNRKTVEGSSVYLLGLHKSDNNMQVAMRENSVIELENDFEQKYSGFDPNKDESYIIFEMAQKKNLSQSIRLAEGIQKELVNGGRTDRGVHQAGFWVLWATSMPSVLIELDFICNPQSAKYISSDKGAKELAQSIFKAIETYEKNWRKSRKSLADDPSNMEERNNDSSDDMLIAFAVPSDGRAGEKSDIKHVIADKTNVNSELPRRRRSQSAKKVSEQSTYEADALVSFPQGKSRSIAELYSEEEDSQKLAQDNSDKEQPIKTSNKKSKEKKKKSKGKIDRLQTVYQIQIYASSVLLNQNSPCFCGLSPVTAYKEKDMYKYMYAESSDKKEIEAILATVKEKIPDAFIVKSTKSISSSHK